MRKAAVPNGLLFLTFFMLYAQRVDAQTNPLELYILHLHEKVENENRLVGEFNPAQAHSLPLGVVKEIGSSRYIICIDSAWFTPQGAFFNAYMALEFPGSTRKLAFAAKNIMFNPQGVMPGPLSRLTLASEHTLKLGPNIHMILKPDGSNFVEWDCNGFNAVNLKGNFEFNPALLQPDPKLAPNAQKVTASFEVYTQDVHNIIVQTNVSPFIVKGIKDVGFSVTGATVDLSETTDVAAMQFPAGYQNPSNTLPGSWTGFYLKNLTVRLPDEFAQGSQPTTLQANNMIIDQTGLSGTFSGTNLVSIQSGNMSGWGFSVTDMGITLANNHITAGGMKGKVKLPVSDNGEFAFQAQIMENHVTQMIDYNFMVSPAENIHANVLNAQLTILPSSFIRVEKSNGKLIPFAKLNGQLAFTNNNIQTGKITFQNFQFGTTRPYIYSGTFGLGEGNNTAGNFPISIDEVYLLVSQTNPGIGLKVNINFMEQSDNGFSASTAVALYAKIEEQEVVASGENGDSRKTVWSFDKAKIHDIIIQSNSQLYGLDGRISFRDNDPVYGKGFFGQLGLTLKKPDELQGKTMAFSSWFGRVNGYRYFYVDGNFPVKIVMGNLTIYQLYGGLFYHMKNSKSPEQMMVAPNGIMNASLFYVPDNNIGIGFKAGTTLAHTVSANACNAEAVMELLFNSQENGGGLNSISFAGNIFFMTSIAARQNKPITSNKMYGGFYLTYDFNNRIFHAVANTYINYSPVTSFGQCIIHYEPQSWYVCFGKPSQRVNIGINGLASLSAYVMLGQMLEPMPPVPANVAQIVGAYNMNNNRNETELADAKGIAMGATLNMGFGGQFGDEKFSIYYGIGAGAGFDVMVANYGPTAHCSGGSESAGINGWYATGQLYAYLSGHVGARGHVKFLPGCDNFCLLDQDFDIVILSLSAAAVLQARLPKPYYVAGAVGVTYDILGVINGNVNFDFKLGEYCSVVN